jgi:hypothetical protein
MQLNFRTTSQTMSLLKLNGVYIQQKNWNSLQKQSFIKKKKSPQQSVYLDSFP